MARKSAIKRQKTNVAFSVLESKCISYSTVYRAWLFSLLPRKRKMKKGPPFTTRYFAQSYHTQSVTPELFMSYYPNRTSHVSQSEQQIKTGPPCFLSASSQCLSPVHNSPRKLHSTFWSLLCTQQ